MKVRLSECSYRVYFATLRYVHRGTRCVGYCTRGLGLADFSKVNKSPPMRFFLRSLATIAICSRQTGFRRKTVTVYKVELLT